MAVMPDAEGTGPGARPSTGVAPWIGGVLFSCPYLVMWGLTLYTNLVIVPARPGHPPVPVFNLLLNFAQFVPPALAAYGFGRRFAAIAATGQAGRKVAVLTISVVAYEVLMIMGLLVLAKVSGTLPRNFPPSLWAAIPVMAFLLLSAVLGLAHGVAAAFLKALGRKRPEAPCPRP